TDRVRQAKIMHRAHHLLALGFVLLLAAAWLGRRPAEKAAAAPADEPPAAAAKFLFLGAGSCAAAACHNGGGPRGAVGSEYTTWVTDDPHARAYAVLFEQRSRRIQ